MNEVIKTSVKNPDLFPVTVLGLGNMGQALAAAYLAAGYPVTVWNRTAGKADRLVGTGAVQAATATEAVASGKVAVVCLSTYDVVRNTLFPLEAELAGRLVVNLTTGTPEDARTLDKWAKEKGIDYLDGAIMAVPPMIGTQEALILYGGRKELFHTYQSVLTVMGGSTTYLNENPGVALLYDLSLLTMLYGAWYSYFHAHALLRTANITAEEFLPYASNWLQHVIVPSLTSPEAPRILDGGNYATDVSNLAINKIGLDNIINSSLELGVPAEWLLPIQTAAAQLVTEGYGNDGFERIFETMIKRNDPTFSN